MNLSRMKILFVLETRADAGSIHAVSSYIRAGDQLGHFMALYGCQHPDLPTVRFSSELKIFDYVVFIVESGLHGMSGLRFAHILSSVPEQRRVIIDTDGMYSPLTRVEGYDRNHSTEQARSDWLAFHDPLAKRVFQTRLEPDETAGTLPFFGFDETLAVSPQASPPKRFDIVQVGHNWWRWQDVKHRLLPALELIRAQLDGVCFVGCWWDAPPPWAAAVGLEPAFRVEPGCFERLRIEIRPPVPYRDVIRTMSEGRVNLMTQRPLFRQLKILTAKYFEIFCADTVPLVLLDPGHAEAIYGPAGRELALHQNLEEKLGDALRRPQEYKELAGQVRSHLAERHSYRQRVRELVTALES